MSDNLNMESKEESEFYLSEDELFRFKQRELLSKFTEHFKFDVQFDPLCHAVFTILSKGGDPYKIIEELINKCISLQNELSQKKLESIEFNTSRLDYLGFKK